MKNLIALFIIISFSLASVNCFSQPEDKKAELSLSADLVSSYMWRGSQLSGLPCVQPYASFTYGNFYAGFWASSPLTGPYETDFLIGYSHDYFGLSVVDYYVSDFNLNPGNYFRWQDDLTSHDLSFELSFPGTEKIPFRALAAFNFYGADTENSRYYEAAWLYEKDDFCGEIFIGGTDAAGWYGDYEGVVNTGVSLSKEIQITEKFSLPVFSKIIVNPQKENIYFVFGITLK